MNLSEILQKRTAIDLDIATARALEISLEIQSASAELKRLRSELQALEANAERKRRPEAPANNSEAPATNIAIPTPASTPSLKKQLHNKIRRLFSPAPLLRWNLDEIGGAFRPREKGMVSASISRTSLPSLTLSGWLIPVENNPAFSAVGMRLIRHEKQISRNMPTYARADVAAHFGESRFISCGFRFEVPMFEIPNGEYDLEISGHQSDGAVISVRVGTIEITE